MSPAYLIVAGAVVSFTGTAYGLYDACNGLRVTLVGIAMVLVGLTGVLIEVL